MSSKYPRRSSVYEYFTKSTDEKYFICQCETLKCGIDGEKKICGQKISSFRGSDKDAPTRASNLLRHIARFHPQIINKIEEEKKTRATEKEISGPCTSTSGQAYLTSYFTSDKITITMTAESFKRNIISLVVQNGVSLNLFSQPAFLGLNGEIATKLGISLDRENIRKLILHDAMRKKQILKDDLRGKFIYLKMDAATRHRVNYFAINARYVNNDGAIVTKTLAVKDTEAHHDSHYLQKLIEEVLKEFDIKKEQILCIVTDNASNMIKTIQRMNEYEEIVAADEKSTDLDIETSQEYSYEALDDVTEQASKLCQIKQMRCAVHTLQLAIRDGLKEPHATNLIGKFRQAAIAARTPKIDAILRRRAGKGAIIDQATRWGSTYLMIKRLLELRTYLEDVDNPNVSLTEKLWNDLAELETILCTPYITTRKLQSEELTGGLFLREWKNVIFVLSKMGGLIAEGIISSMKKREANLLDNEILLSSIYVDPKHRILLDDEQIEKAKKAIYELSLRMKIISEKLEDSNQDNQTANIANESFSSSSNDELDFEKYLDMIQKSKKIKTQNQEPLNINIKKCKQDFYKSFDEIEKYDRSCRTPLSELIQIYPVMLKEVALTVTALPPTQVSVERLFSALKFIKSDLRSSIKEDLANAILFLRNY